MVVVVVEGKRSRDSLESLEVVFFFSFLDVCARFEIPSLNKSQACSIRLDTTGAAQSCRHGRIGKSGNAHRGNALCAPVITHMVP